MGSPRGNEGERLLRESYDTVLAVGTVSAPYTAKKSRTEKKVPYEMYAVRRKQNVTMNRKITKLCRTAYSTYRPYGIILQKSLLCCRVDKGFDAYKAAHPAATGQVDVMYCTRDPKVGTLVFFVSCLNIRGILQKGRKNGKTATEKEKSPYWLQSCNSKGREETVY